MIDALALVAVLAPALAGVLAWGSPARRAAAVAGLAILVGGLASLSIVWQVFSDGTAVGTGGVVRVDALGAYMLLVVAIVVALAVAASPRYVAAELREGHIREGDAGRYYALLLWFASCLGCVPLVDNLGLVWIAVEAATGVSALLVGFYRTPAALEAAWKYLMLGSVGVGFALLGTILAYASSIALLGETSDALNWSRLMSEARHLDPGLLRLAFLFVLAGYGTKVGLAPFHTWLPDAHSQAPSPVSAVLSGVSLVVALYALVRFHLVAQAALGPAFSSLLLVAFGLFSMAAALPFLVAQGDLKRLLAYSSIEHMGLLTVAIGFGGHLALLGATVHVLGHALVKSTAFLAAGEVVQRYRSRRLGRIRGVLSAAPGAGGGLLASTLLAAGLPPSAVFTAEIAILVGGVQTGWGIAAGAAAVLLAASFAAIAFHVVPIGWGRPGRRVVISRPGAWASVMVTVPLAAVAILGVWTPAPLADAFEAVVAVLGGGHG